MRTKEIIPTLVLAFFLILNSGVIAQSAAVASVSSPVYLAENLDDVNGQMYGPETKMPEFPGGNHGVQTYLSKVIRYPEMAEQYGVEGKVVVRAMISDKGEIVDAEIVKGLFLHCDREALTAIKAMPDWKPALKNEVAVASKVLLTVNFNLD